MAICGVWYGGMFNHTKDVPFASAMMGALYFLIRAGRDLPVRAGAISFWFGILLGAALGLRATGLLMFGYAGVVIILYSWPRSATKLERRRAAGRSLVGAFRSRLCSSPM